MTPSQFELFMRRLIKMKTPKAPFQVLEYYAGVARIATLAKHYAFKFAGKMVRVMDQARRDAAQRPPRIVTSFDSLITLFTNMEWCNESIAWDEEGDLRDAIRYARGSKKLSIPPEWRDALPTTIPPLQP
ncbi:unnamed protein product [Cladocopium goreaui]|uniref:Uncharacterized protein n=1 Tax=Cladocopium goreaui TaxID=2562237 RepID=A0A9P1GD02_9DINO|nr:unnamed protein product [Cladocopium goreaui]